MTDDLPGEALDGQLVTIAKPEEVTEIYRRTVWTEAPVADCIRDTGKPPRSRSDVFPRIRGIRFIPMSGAGS